LKLSRRAAFAGVAATVVVAGIVGWAPWRDEGPHYLRSSPQAFAARFAAPPAAGSDETRRELDELLEIQASRTTLQVDAARADRKTRIERFYPALGFGADPPPLPRLERLAERVEDDVRIHVRAAKERFRRLRPPEIEPRLEPCIGDVRSDLSFPSGHAAYGWSMAYLLSELVPERSGALQTRAAEFARQRMICGVHYRSDLEAGRVAARLLLAEMAGSAEFRAERAAAAIELRDALALD
jgi:acid phosphatase (class A)